MIKKIKQAFDKWNDLLDHCRCGGETKDTVTSWIDYVPCESETRCTKCGTVVAYWAYGSFDGPITKTQAVHFWLMNRKWDIKKALGL